MWLARIAPALSPIVTIGAVVIAVPCFALPPTISTSLAHAGLRDAAASAERGTGTMTVESLAASLDRADVALARERADAAALRRAIADAETKDVATRAAVDRLKESEQSLRVQLRNASAAVAAGAATEARLQQSLTDAQREASGAREAANIATSKLAEAQTALTRAAACEENLSRKDSDAKSCRDELNTCRSAAKQGSGRLPVPPVEDRGPNAPPR